MSNKLPPLPVGVAPGSGYWNDWYEKLRTLINSFAAGFPFSSITNTPTTLSGYGITDGVANSRTISTTAPLTGGGDLSANRTLAISQFAGSSPGSVPTSLGGTTNFLRADGSWAAPSGGGGGSSLTQVTGTDANVTMAVNSLYVLDGSILTADRTYTLPATAAVGDKVGIMLTAGSSSYEVLLTASSGDTLNGIAGGTEWSRVFITGEVVVIQCTVANTTWIVDQDGRIPQKAKMYLSTAADGEAASTYTRPTAAATPGAWTDEYDNANLTSTSNDRIYSRRTNLFIVAVAYAPKDAGTTGQFVNLEVRKNSSTVVGGPSATLTAANVNRINATMTTSISAGDYVDFYYRTFDGNIGAVASAPWVTTFSITEVF